VRRRSGTGAFRCAQGRSRSAGSSRLFENADAARRIAGADLSGFSLGGLLAYAVALGAPARVGTLIVASADAHRPPGRESAPPGGGRMPAPADFQAMRGAYDAVAPGPAHFDEFAARTSAMVQVPGVDR